MYKNFYNLTMEPFRLTPDQRLCYRHPSYQSAKNYMEYAVKQGEDFVLITGEPGTGKTMLISDVLANVNEEKLIIARLIGTNLLREDPFRTVALAFGLNITTQDNLSILRMTRQFLTEQIRAGHRALLIVDEAQMLSSATLEVLGLMSNLLQIFLVGQERLLKIAINPSMARLHQRLIAACRLNPLNLEQTEAYIKHRLSLVGWKEDPRLDDDIFTLIHKHSRGVPRSINLLCNRLFSKGFVERKHEFSARDVRHIVEELRRESLVHSEDEVVKNSSRLPGHASQNSVLRASNSRAAEQPSSQQSTFFPMMSRRHRSEAESKLAVHLVAKNKQGTRYRNNNKIIILTIGLLGIVLILTFVITLNLQKSPTSTLLSQDEENQNAKALHVDQESNKIVKNTVIQPKNMNPESVNEQVQFIDGESSHAGSASNEISTVGVKERQILPRSGNQHGAWQPGAQSDQQGQLDSLDDRKGVEDAKLKTRRLASMATVGNESVLKSQSQEQDELLKQNKHEITKLLTEAERQREAFKLTIPPGDNACETYQRVLSLDPTNREAKKGLTELLNYYLQQAILHKNKGLLESSLDFIYRGLTVEPKNAELLALKEQVRPAIPNLP